MNYEKIQTSQNNLEQSLSVEAVVQQIERVTNGEGTPYSDEPFSDAPPGVINTIIRRLSFEQTISKKLKSRLQLCELRMEYIVHSSWHNGYNACSSLKKRCQDVDLLIQTGHLEASYLYPADKAHWYWFLAGWLSACRVK